MIEPDANADVQDLWLEPWGPGWCEQLENEVGFYHAILDSACAPDAVYWVGSRVMGAMHVEEVLSTKEAIGQSLEVEFSAEISKL
eukprot:6903659-Pyramimonas_sp.AAC.1